MTEVGSYEAKTNLARLIERVEKGETFTITRHGRGVARLVPVDPVGASPETVVAELRAARHGVRRGRSSVRQMIDEGRR